MLVALTRALVFVCRRIVGNQPVKLANNLERIARSEAEGELESFGLVYVSHAAGSHLAVASPAEAHPLDRGLVHMTDRIAARRYEAERAGPEARRDGRTRYSTGNEKRQGICSGDEPRLFLAQTGYRHLAPKLDAFSNAVKPPRNLDKHDGQKPSRGNAQENNNDKREFQRLHHETVNLCGAHLVLLGNLINHFPIKRYRANNRNESQVEEEQRKQEIQHKASFLE